MSVNIESDAALQNALKDLLTLAGLPDSTSLNAQSVQEAVNKLKSKLPASERGTPTAKSGGEAMHHESALVIGPLGMVLHQVKHLLSPNCTNVTLAKNMEEAFVSYQQTHPSFIVIDILMPTSREGLGLIQAIRQLAQKANQPAPQIVVLCTVNQEENLKDNCHSQSIKHVLDRQDGWQQNILDILSGKTG